ncbi:MAG: hypothetical protein ABEJ56_02985 [Candidatus Nanohaloarchaea archaeon]
MSYYDNVKDDIKNQGDSDENTASFDTLKQAAQEEKSDEEKANDTPIEVLEEGGLSKREASQGKQKSREKAKQEKEEIKQPVEKNREANSSGIEEKLDRIIEQNDRMIEILEGFSS